MPNADRAGRRLDEHQVDQAPQPGKNMSRQVESRKNSGSACLWPLDSDPLSRLATEKRLQWHTEKAN